jgi:predicted AAA+ superfamily ATPase
LGFSPLIGILGHRQVGKTTLLEEICSEYYTLDAGEKGRVVYFEDQAEALYLDKRKSQQTQMEGFLYRQIRQEFY